MSYYLGATVKLEGLPEAHITLVYLGPRTEEELTKIWQEANNLEDLSFEFGEWKTFETPKGDMVVRTCRPTNVETTGMLRDLYKKYYHHSPGEAKERLEGPTYHVTLSNPRDHEHIDKLKVYTCPKIFIKQGKTLWCERLAGPCDSCRGEPACTMRPCGRCGTVIPSCQRPNHRQACK